MTISKPFGFLILGGCSFKNEFEQRAHRLCLKNLDGLQIEKKKIQIPLGMVACTFNPSTWEEAGSLCEFGRNLVLHREFQASQNFKGRPCLKQTTNRFAI